jgi:hypothetical protein
MGGPVKFVKENGVPYFIWRYCLKILLESLKKTTKRLSYDIRALSREWNRSLPSEMCKRKGCAMFYLKVPSQDFARATEKNYEKPQLWYPNPEPRMKP